MSKRTKPPSGRSPDQAQVDNRAEQLNPDSVKYWKARGLEKRPENGGALVPKPKLPPKQDE